MYAVIASVCAERAISSDPGGDEPGIVDACVVLVDHRAGRAPVLDLAAFATAVHPWRTVFHASGEQGYALLAEFLALAEGRQKLLQSQIVVVEGGLSLCHATPALRADGTPGSRGAETGQDDAITGYHTVCLGGTFDHLHPGHKLLLHAAALLLRVPDAAALESGAKPCVLIVGISGDELLGKKQYAEELQPWDARARSVVAFLATALNAPTTAVPTITAASNAGAPNATELHATFCSGAVLVRCFDLRDPFGPTTAEQPIDAIVVSGETRAGGQAINERRAARGWHALDIYEIDILDAHGGDDNDETAGEQHPQSATAAAAAAAADRFAAKISSTEIRRQKAEARRRRHG